MVEIDIKTRVYSSHDKAYRLFPGSSYRYFDLMRDESIVLLDYLGIKHRVLTDTQMTMTLFCKSYIQNS